MFLAWPERTPPFLEIVLQHRHASTLHERFPWTPGQAACPSGWAEPFPVPPRPHGLPSGQARSMLVRDSPPVPFRGPEGSRQFHTESLTRPGVTHTTKSNPAAEPHVFLGSKASCRPAPAQALCMRPHQCRGALPRQRPARPRQHPGDPSHPGASGAQ